MCKNSEIEALIRDYSLGNILDIKKIDCKSTNTMWLIESSIGKYCIKEVNASVYRQAYPGRNIEDIFNPTEEIAVNFSENGVNTVQALKHKDSYVNKSGEHYYIIYPFVEGYTIKKFDDVNSAYIKEAAKIVAKMHDTKGLEKIGNPVFFKVSSPKEWESFISNNNIKSIIENPKISFANKERLKEIEGFKARLNIFLDKIKIWSEKGSKYYQEMITPDTIQPLHYDLNFSNILWNKEGDNLKATVVDWEMAGLGHASVELVCYALEWAGALSKGKIIPENFANFLNSYLECRQSKNELKLEGAFYIWLSGRIMACAANYLGDTFIIDETDFDKKVETSHRMIGLVTNCLEMVSRFESSILLTLKQLEEKGVVEEDSLKHLSWQEKEIYKPKQNIRD